MSVAPGLLPPTWLLEAAGADGQAARLVARTLFREMQRSGFTQRQVLAVADELLGCLCAAVGPSRAGGAPADARVSDRTGD